MAVDVTVRAVKPPALHGQEGWSRKGPEPGNASYYYSFTRLAATGVVTTAAGVWPVDGGVWMDHEWSTSALADGRQGWDWLSLQLDDGRDIMAFQIRDAAGAAAPGVQRQPRRRHGQRPVVRGERLRLGADGLVAEPAHRRTLPIGLALCSCRARTSTCAEAPHGRSGAGHGLPLLGGRGHRRRHFRRAHDQGARLRRADRLRGGAGALTYDVLCHYPHDSGACYAFTGPGHLSYARCAGPFASERLDAPASGATGRRGIIS
ncbi:MAG: hypothetical protein IPG72_14910 [Ardenticatenales bacterium]|nr:hypothetical protein [Ardenticatenales bacterium]